MTQTLTRTTERAEPEQAGQVSVSMTVVDAFDGFVTLEKRSPTLDGSVPVRANPGCAPFLEGNAAGFQLYLCEPGTLRVEGRRLELRLPDLAKAKVFDAYAARLEALVDRGMLERDGFWHRRLRNSPIRQTADGLALWTGLLVRPARGLWVLLSRAFNRRSMISVVDEIYADDTAFVPVILNIDRRSLQQPETWLDMELACLTPVKPGVRFTISSIEDSPDVGHALNGFYDEAYLERRFNQGKTTAAYRRLTRDQPTDGAEGSAACRLVVAGGPNIHRVSRFKRYLTGQGIARKSPAGDDLQFAVVANVFPVSGRWDGHALRNLSGPTANSSRKFRRRWEDLYGVENDFVKSLSEYVPYHPRKRLEPNFVIASWTFAATPPGWSTLLDGYIHGKVDGLRGVLSTDSYHWLGPVYQFYEPQAFSIPRGAPAAPSPAGPARCAVAAVSADGPRRQRDRRLPGHPGACRPAALRTRWQRRRVVMRSHIEGERTGDDRAWPCLHELVEQQARRAPDAVAVRCGREKVTYGELAEWSDRIARTLVHREVVPGDPVAVLLPNGASFAAAALGVLRAGGVLFPLDTRLPAERVRVLLGEARPQVLISRLASAEILAASGEIVPVNPDALLAPSTDRGSLPQLDARSIAYLLYTSGTTGERKGVLTPHAGVSSHLAWLYGEMPLPEQSRILMRSPQIFDIWLLEFFWALGGGHQLVMAETERAADPVYLLQLLRDEMIAGLNAVPSLLRRITAWPEFRELDALRYVLSCGEPLDAALATAILANPHTALYNLYGPTEASIIATHHRVDPGDVQDPVPIGRPLPRTSIHVLDPARSPVPPGACGELYIGGIAVGAGYLRQEAAGAERFIERIDGIRGRWFYRTGDLGLVRDNGDIIFLGRADGQVKINGVRIETAELEAALRAHPSVLDCAVVVKSLGVEASRLIAYVVPGDRKVTEHQLAAYLYRELPGAMVHPAAILMLDELPVLPNGKRDYGALPVPGRLPRTLPEKYQGPRTELERRLVAVWEEQLKVSPIGVHDDFYRLGGDPLLAFDTLATMTAEICPGIPRYELTQLPTVAEIARFIEERDLQPCTG